MIKQEIQKNDIVLQQNLQNTHHISIHDNTLFEENENSFKNFILQEYEQDNFNESDTTHKQNSSLITLQNQSDFDDIIDLTRQQKFITNSNFSHNVLNDQRHANFEIKDATENDSQFPDLEISDLTGNNVDINTQQQIKFLTEDHSKQLNDDILEHCFQTKSDIKLSVYVVDEALSAKNDHKLTNIINKKLNHHLKLKIKDNLSNSKINSNNSATNVQLKENEELQNNIYIKQYIVFNIKNNATKDFVVVQNKTIDTQEDFISTKLQNKNIQFDEISETNILSLTEQSSDGNFVSKQNLEIKPTPQQIIPTKIYNHIKEITNYLKENIKANTDQIQINLVSNSWGAVQINFEVLAAQKKLIVQSQKPEIISMLKKFCTHKSEDNDIVLEIKEAIKI